MKSFFFILYSRHHLSFVDNLNSVDRTSIFRTRKYKTIILSIHLPRGKTTSLVLVFVEGQEPGVDTRRLEVRREVDHSQECRVSTQKGRRLRKAGQTQKASDSTISHTLMNTEGKKSVLVIALASSGPPRIGTLWSTDRSSFLTSSFEPVRRLKPVLPLLSPRTKERLLTSNSDLAEKGRDVNFEPLSDGRRAPQRRDSDTQGTPYRTSRRAGGLVYRE